MREEEYRFQEQEENYDGYFEVLELPPGSSPSEVRTAYIHLKELYSTDSIVLSPLESELSDEWRQHVLERIEEAYAKLKELFERTPAARRQWSPREDAFRAEEVEAGEIFSGEALMRLREKRGVEIHELSMATKINRQHLKNIEAEKYSALPEKVFLKGYLAAYAKHLSIDPRKVVSDYMARYNAWERLNTSTQT
jgi:curved DNA-binding protein CbpA